WPPTCCADAAEERCDPRTGTAAPAARWLLVEQPGPWGRDALTQSRLDARVGAELARRGAAAGLRVQVVRRHGRVGHHPQGRRHWALVDSRPGHEAARWGRFEHDVELLDVDLTSPVTPVPGEAVRPVYLVCTHGRHDTCCAVRGRDVAAALEPLAPGRVWECSHVGGCRFAANVVVLPHGLYYGGVTPALATELVDATEASRLVPDLLRGRSTGGPAEQAAEHHARLGLDGDGRTRLGALRPVATEPTADGAVRVVLARDDAQEALAVTVRRVAAGPPALLTCAARRASPPQAWQLVDVRPARPAEGSLPAHADGP
ncbi:sucrase ferredoxin, partial [Aquipuribacter sp. SD81]|uniref:sucrase ferredoxin n=1 Tax=Aquipuribacter sp. SD81 TaxID=3127703 RepID=UPI003019AEF4